MLEKITGTFSNIVKTISGKSTITEKNIEETVEQIKMALFVLSAVLLMQLLKKQKVKKFFVR